MISRSRTAGWLALTLAACTQPGSPVGPGSNRAPVVARATVEPSVVAVGGEAQLTVEASDPDGDQIFYRYAADGGEVRATTDSPSVAVYTNRTAGTEDRIVVTVTDSKNASTSFALTVALQGNRPPELSLPNSDPCHPACQRNDVNDCQPSCSLNFQARASDPDGDALTFSWSGCVDESNAGRGTCRISAPGRYSATVIVRDGRGGTSVASASGEGTNRAPIVTGGAVFQAIERRLIIGENDPDGDPISCAWAGTCQCTGDTQSYNQNCVLPAGLGRCSQTATCFDPFGARGSTTFDLVRP